MLVILKQKVEHLGNTGDVVRVKPGFARNFLFRKNLCVHADESNIKEMEHHKRILEKKRIAERASAQEVADKLSEFTVVITRKVGEKDKLYGSVNHSDILEVLNQAGFNLTKSELSLDAPIKAIGVQSVKVKLHPEVVTTVKVEVVAEQEAES